jgi:hypothetical protein
MFEVLRRKRFRRILFLVDRNAVGTSSIAALAGRGICGLLVHKGHTVAKVSFFAFNRCKESFN